MRDVDRAVSGLLMPFPEAVDPPGDVTPERRQEILADPRVQVGRWVWVVWVGWAGGRGGDVAVLRLLTS